MIAPRIEDRRPFTIVLVALIALAWAVLVVWGQSPYSRFLSHEALGELDGARGLAYVGVASVFVAAWTLMTVAMMLPTSLPLLLLFQRFVSRRSDSVRLVALLVGGYLSVWVVFGAAAHLADLGLHAAVQQSRVLEERSWILGAAPLILAGVYQFTPLKYFCLDKCRSPYAFILSHWHGRNQKLEAFLLGVHHGIFCVGCCWSLMLMMFGVGVGNLGWMLAIGAVMAVEKNMPWGRRLSAPLGVVLLAAGMTLVVTHSASVACAC